MSEKVVPVLLSFITDEDIGHIVRNFPGMILEAVLDEESGGYEVDLEQGVKVRGKTRSGVIRVVNMYAEGKRFEVWGDLNRNSEDGEVEVRVHDDRLRMFAPAILGTLV